MGSCGRGRLPDVFGTVHGRCCTPAFYLAAACLAEARACCFFKVMLSIHCLIAENPAITTRCNHRFHLACIYEWLERSQTCPICSQKLEFDELL